MLNLLILMGVVIFFCFEVGFCFWLFLIEDLVENMCLGFGVFDFLQLYFYLLLCYSYYYLYFVKNYYLLMVKKMDFFD